MKKKKLLCVTLAISMTLGGASLVKASNEILGWSEDWETTKPYTPTSRASLKFNENSYSITSTARHEGYVVPYSTNLEYYVGHTWWKTSNYTRARGEIKHLILPTDYCGDTGRKLSNSRGYSEAVSTTCVTEYTGKTYYGAQ